MMDFVDDFVTIHRGDSWELALTLAPQSIYTSGTTAQVARSLGRKAIGFELNADYIRIAAEHRLNQGVLL